MKNQKPWIKKSGIVYGLLTLLFLLFFIWNLCQGSTNIGVRETFLTLFSGDRESLKGVILWNIRLPRILAAAFLGGSLALAGYMLQSFFHNPIAGPYVLGISSGAKLLVAILMVVCAQTGSSLSSWSMILAAFLGAMISTVFVLTVAKKVKNMAILIVCGVMIGYICSAVTELLVTFADDSNIVNLHNWSQGSFSATGWSQVAYFVPIALLGLGFTLLLSKEMEAYQYGEAYAKSVGVRVGRFRLFLILGSCLLAATVTAFAGPISFVGIAVPQILRSCLRTENPRLLIPGCFMGGAVFCLFCDLLARSLFAPTELSISTVTAVFGAPVVIAMLLQRKRGV